MLEGAAEGVSFIPCFLHSPEAWSAIGHTPPSVPSPHPKLSPQGLLGVPSLWHHGGKPHKTSEAKAGLATGYCQAGVRRTHLSCSHVDLLINKAFQQTPKSGSVFSVVTHFVSFDCPSPFPRALAEPSPQYPTVTQGLPCGGVLVLENRGTVLPSGSFSALLSPSLSCWAPCRVGSVCLPSP